MKRLLLAAIFLVSSLNHGMTQVKTKGFWVQKGHMSKTDKVLYHHWNMAVYKSKDGTGHLKVFHADNFQITKSVKFKSDKLKVRHGKYRQWYANGKLMREGQYQEGEKVGQWNNYNFPKGYLESSVMFKNGEKNGPLIRYDSTGNVRYAVHYRNNKLQGNGRHFTTTGDTLMTCSFDQGVLIGCDNDIPIIDSLFKKPEKMPYISTANCKENQDSSAVRACRNMKLYNEIFKRLKYSKKERRLGVSGESIVRFVIERDGTISNIEMMIAISDNFTKECIRVVEELPNWVPGEFNGAPIRVQYNLPIRFKLE